MSKKGERGNESKGGTKRKKILKKVKQNRLV